MSATVGSNNPSRDGPPGGRPHHSSRGGLAPPGGPGVGPARVSLSTEWVVFEPLPEWILSEHCLEENGFTIVSQLGGDGAHLLTGAGACFPLERSTQAKRITGTLVKPGVVHFAPAVAERGLGGGADQLPSRRRSRRQLRGARFRGGAGRDHSSRVEPQRNRRGRARADSPNPRAILTRFRGRVWGGVGSCEVPHPAAHWRLHSPLRSTGQLPGPNSTERAP